MGCSVKKCREGSAYLYYGRRVCEKHWEKHCSVKDRFDLKSEFNIKVVDKSEENDEAPMIEYARPPVVGLSSESKPLRGSAGLLSSYLEVER